MFCSKCGAANNDDHRFCQNCSHPLAGSDIRSGKTGSRTSPLKVILIVLALLAVSFMLLVVFTPDDPKAAAATPGDVPVAESSSPVAPMQETAAPDSAIPATQYADTAATASSDVAVEAVAAVADAGAVSADDDAIGEAEAAAADSLYEVGDIREKDVFDWNAATDEEKNQMAFACQMYWYAGGVTGEPVDISATDLAKKIGEALSDQSYVFEAACALYDLEPAQWNDTVE